MLQLAFALLIFPQREASPSVRAMISARNRLFWNGPRMNVFVFSPKGEV
jgi:hypothetical protein